MTEDWYFCSHRLPLARAAVEAGFDVGVITRVREHGDLIRNAGVKLHPVHFARSAGSPLRDLRVLWAVVRIYRRERPDLVHHVSIKPIVFGSLAAAVSGVPHVINAYTGLGYVFTSEDSFACLLRALMTRVLRPWLAAEGTWAIVQNPDDQRLLEEEGLVARERCTLVRGSGVDTRHFAAHPPAEGVPVVLFAGRLLWDKGLGEFVAAARRLRSEGISARFVLVGEPDSENPRSVPTAVLEGWNQEKVIEWRGRCTDMAEAFREAAVVCLPSYREGLPKVLIEAAFCARPLVAADTPGCREIVRHGENGLRVPARDAVALADALKKLLGDPGMRRRMGERGRAIAEAEFSMERVIAETLALYRRLLKG